MKFFDEYFVFSTSEKRGIFGFLVLIIILCILYWMIPFVFSPDSTDFSQWEDKLSENELKPSDSKPNPIFHFNPNTISSDSLLMLGLSSKQANNIVNYRNKVGEFKKKEDFKKIYSISDSTFEAISPYLVFDSKQSKSSNSKQKFKTDSLFAFDPNTVSMNELIHLGFTQKQARIVLNFRDKGGKFFKKEDVKKIYSVSDKLYQKLEPFIKIENQDKPNLTPRTKFDEKRLTISINQSDASEFEKISGIGPKLSKRIIKFRDKLGGFYSVHQLKEVFGLDSNLVNRNFQSFFVFPNETKKININTVTFKELLAHPYFSYGTTQKIINYREQHGSFSSVEEILNNNLIKPEQYRKIVSYISLN